MKKFVAIITLFVLLVLPAHAAIYPQTFIVDGINREKGLLILADFNGDEWGYLDVDDFKVGDVVAAIMNDNDTPNIYDDDIITIRYTGYIEGWE